MRILFVENHAVFAETVIVEFLSDHSVVVCPEADKSLQLLMTQPFDVALVDYDLDGGKGDAFIRTARERGVLLPIVACSARLEGNCTLVDAGASAACPKAAFSGIGAVLSSLAPLPTLSTLSAAPRAASLAATVVRHLGAACAPRTLELAALFTELLFGPRSYWQCLREGILTHTELRSVLLAHAYTLLEAELGPTRNWRNDSYLELVPSFEGALFRNIHGREYIEPDPHPT